MKLKVYVYKNCDTCRKALKFLDKHGIAHEAIPIRETPPSQEELRRMLQVQSGNLRSLFNTSGGDYKTLGMKDRLPSISDEEAIALLASNGNLVKRPFVISKDFALIGFNEETWKTTLL
ncbi:MAG: arsenate reductase family protein [Candidatus Hydrogenedentes bacterium]|nr:arsenate reductase family protein [Candidatus Hydrogenedentota bacterium]